MTGHHVDHAARAEDVRWLAATGESLTGAAKRLGIGRDGLEKWCTLNGMRGELNKLRAREPADVFVSERARHGAAARWAS